MILISSHGRLSFHTQPVAVTSGILANSFQSDEGNLHRPSFTVFGISITMLKLAIKCYIKERAKFNHFLLLQKLLINNHDHSGWHLRKINSICKHRTAIIRNTALTVGK